MTEEAQSTAPSLHNTAPISPSLETRPSSNPEPNTSSTPATFPNTSTAAPTGSSNSLHEPSPDPHDLPPSEGPNIHIPAFDWASLEERYDADMQTCAARETALFEEFNEAIRANISTQLFESWASVTTTHENERSYKRLKTRMSYVQGDEHRLEKKRQHWTNFYDGNDGGLKALGTGGMPSRDASMARSYDHSIDRDVSNAVDSNLVQTCYLKKR
ncbi:hypothetical protein MMC11_005825 [Xylographa trunciseda]|nr:hypothetical protein [Xylographa trunciseda]